MTKRVWELDALRGSCILGMVAVHLLFDLRSLGLRIDSPLFSFVLNWGGVLFVLLSGVCVTLGSRHIRRGLTVLGCGILCTGVTLALHLLGFGGKGIVIRFGVLHCLGCCMVLWCLFSRLKTWLLAALGISFAVIGLCIEGIATVSHPWLMPLGFVYPEFTSADYFPLLPYLGYFLLGAVLGRTLYRSKTSLLPGVDPGRRWARFLCLCGRYSLPIYLLHQPVLTGILSIPVFLTR